MHDGIREAVRRSPLTQTEIGSHLGLSQPAISDRLRGRTRWTAEEVRRLARLLDTTVDELLNDPAEVK